MSLVEVLPCEAYLRQRKIRFELVPHESTDTTAAEARALRIPSEEVLKAVVLRVGDDYALAILPGSRKLDIHLLDVAAGAHVRLATEEEIEERFPGFELGAIPPIPGLLGVKAFVDTSVQDHDEVAFADGRRTESMIAPTRELLWGEDVYIAPIVRRLAARGTWRFEGDSMEIPEDGW